LYEDIESGVADLADPDLTASAKPWKAKRDLAKADADACERIARSSGRDAFLKRSSVNAADARKKMGGSWKFPARAFSEIGTDTAEPRAIIGRTAVGHLMPCIERKC
jgi:hypothetical protein